MCGSMSSATGTSSLAKLSVVSLSSAASIYSKRPLVYRISESPSKHLDTDTHTFY
jgi:hypothetical protein